METIFMRSVELLALLGIKDKTSLTNRIWRGEVPPPQSTAGGSYLYNRKIINRWADGYLVHNGNCWIDIQTGETPACIPKFASVNEMGQHGGDAA